MNKEQLLSMSLHEIRELNKDLTIVKVLGGWIYVYRNQVSEFVSSRGKD
jgi:hypothetical protein